MRTRAVDALDVAVAPRDNAGVPGEAPTPLPLRPSATDRDRVLRILREGSVDGRLSVDTFSERIERSLAARSVGELDELVADVRPPGRPRRALLAVIAWLSSLEDDLRSAWERPRVPALALPSHAGREFLLGRSRECDCVLAEPSVSRRHAELRRVGGRWLLRDLGSRNGTRVNGVRVLEETEVGPGDRVSFGDAGYRLAA
ncbi:MAG: FHA domain-containing protein [Thermoleophilaceae bacterium]